MTQGNAEGNIYGLIDSIRLRPGMYTPDNSLKTIELLLHGYVMALKVNGVAESYEGQNFTPQLFGDWLYRNRGWSANRGFAHAINENTPHAGKAFDAFFPAGG